MKKYVRAADRRIPMKVNSTDMINQLAADQLKRTNKSDDAKKGNKPDTPFNELLDSVQLSGNDPDAQGVQAAYQNPQMTMDSLVVDKLMQETEDIQGSVNQLIRSLLERQGITEEQLLSGDVEEMTVDEAARQKAAEMIGPGGPLSPEAVSDRIVTFAIGVFGGDQSKIDIIRSSIDRGFDEAENILGSLADVSVKTYDLIQEKLDDWVNGEKNTENSGSETETVED
jgi:hypothetical protein